MIVVAGESLIDLVSVPGGPPRALPGGGPFNVARALARLGAPVAFVGRISTDDHGRRLRAILDGDGVDLTHVVSTDDPTLLAHATLDDAGVARYRFTPARSAAAGLTAADIAGALPRNLTALHVGTLGLVLEPMAETVAELVRSVGDDALVVLDLNIRPSAIDDESAYRDRLERVLRRVDVVKASADDLAWLAPTQDPLAAARDLLAGGPSVVLLTDGSRPVRAVTQGAVAALEVPQVAVVDTVGAGDAFGAGFLAAWTRAGRDRAGLADPDAIVAAARFAIEVAAVTVTRAGADPPTLAQLGGLAPRW